jgi:hypothetical protein
MKEWIPTKIPKIANFYWGNEPLPYLRFLTLKTFSHYNPDWQLRLYTSKDSVKPTWLSKENKNIFNGKDYTDHLKEIPNLTIITVDFQKTIGIPNTTSDVHKSDILRWWLFTKDGGMWIDLDILFWKPITESEVNANKNCNLIFCQCRYGHSIGFLGSSANNEYYKIVLNMAKQRFNEKGYQSVGCELINNSNIHKTLHDFNYRARFIAMETVYPIDAFRIRHIYNANMKLDDPRTIGLHWFAGHDLSYKYVNEITADNYNDFKNDKTGEIYRMNTLLSVLKRINI